MSSIDSIKEYLIKLDLNPNRMPTLKEYKKAYREKFNLHPDRGGDTALFQEITEAALAVFQFISQLPANQS